MSPDRWRQIEAVFEEALDLQGVARAEFVERSCRGDDALRGEVESLLSADEGGVGAAVRRTVQTHANAVSDEHARALIGEKIGAYRVLELIGGGGMGAVYLARRDDDFRKQVAIKLIYRGMASDLFLRYFRRERQILALLEHPYVARLLDGGTTTDGRPYLVMEYVSGQPITTYCDDRRLGPRERVALFRRVCEAVTHAHGNLVVHRDIKPENILVTEDGIPKLLDFGVAKLLDPSLSSRHTSTFLRILTPHYASPEQIRGEPPTTAMDVYSLGAVLYQLVTGKRVHQSAGRSLAEMEHAICARQPDRPRSIRPSLDADLENIVLMALRTDPARRYRSVEQFSDDLSRYLSAMPVIARQDSVWYRGTKFVRRNLLPLGAATAVAASLIAGTVVSVVQAQRAQRRFEHVQKLANVMLFELNDRVRVLPGSLQSRELMVKTGLEVFDGLARESGKSADVTFDLARGYERIAALQASPDPAERTLGRRAEGLASYRRALALAKALEGARSNDPELKLLLANIHLGIGANTTDASERERSFDDALTLLDNVKGTFRSRRWEPDGPPLVEYLGQIVHFARARWLWSQGEFRAAANMGHLAGANLGPHIIVPSLHGMGDLDAALRDSYHFLDSRQSVLSRGSDDILTHINRVSYARATSWIGRLLGDVFAPNLGDPGRAIQVLSRGMDVLRLAIARDPQDPSARRVLRMCELSLADALVTSDPSRAAGIYARIVDESGAGHELRSGLPEQDARWKLTYPLLRLGRYEQALNRARHATGNMPSPRAELALADALAATAHVAEANQQFENAVRSAELRVKERPLDMHARNDLGMAYENYGVFLLSQGNCVAGRKRLTAALALWREWSQYGVSSVYNVTREQRAIALLSRVSRCAKSRPPSFVPNH